MSSPNNPTLKSDEIERKKINISSVKFEAEEQP